MAEAGADIRAELEAAVIARRPEIIDKARAEMDIAAKIDAVGAKGTALSMMFSIWQKFRAGKLVRDDDGERNQSNSYLAYGLGLTDVPPADGEEVFKPLRSFARASMPDVDCDYEDERREDVLAAIRKRWGEDHVSGIGTYGTMHLRSTVRGLIKVVDAANAFHKGDEAFTSENKIKADDILKTLPEPQGAKMRVTGEDGKTYEIKNVHQAYEHCPEFRAYMDRHPAIMRYAPHIEGLVGNFGTHASGILISDVPLSGIAPVRPVTKKDWKGDDVETTSTIFAYEDCETIGLIKFDVLALKMLSIVKHCFRLVKQNHDIDLDIERIPLDDKPTLRLFRSGQLAGVFQCENYGMQKTMRDIGVDRFEDIVAAVALYRPGPMDSIPEYVARKKGLKPVDYFHPTIEKHVKPFLQNTYGIITYQEQVMQVANALAGFSMTEAYDLIKSVGKKIPELLTSYGERFVSGCVAKGVPEDVARQYWGGIDKEGNAWGVIVPFSGYGFNKSHSLCYGYNAYITGYLKANFPLEFMTASMNAEAFRKKWDKVAKLEADCRKSGIVLSKRDVNVCGLEYEIVAHADPARGTRGEIRPSLLCKGLSTAAANSIDKHQPFKDLRDFAARNAKTVDTSSVAALAAAGFFPKGKGDVVVRKFESYRKDLKVLASKGLDSQDMFAGD